MTFPDAFPLVKKRLATLSKSLIPCKHRNWTKKINSVVYFHEWKGAVKESILRPCLHRNKLLHYISGFWRIPQPIHHERYPSTTIVLLMQSRPAKNLVHAHGGGCQNRTKAYGGGPGGEGRPGRGVTKLIRMHVYWYIGEG